MTKVFICCAVLATLLTTAPRAEAAAPNFLDGERLVYVSTEINAAGDIFVLDNEGTRRLTTSTFADGYPRWSPDGSQIAFYSSRDGNNEIYVMDANGSNQTNITNTPAAGEGNPVWSPDGSKIVFNSSVSGDSEVYVMNADGTGRTNLTNDTTGADWAADWSPDGTKIAFQSDRDGNAEIYVMNADGSGQTNLTNNAGGDYGARWSRGGGAIAFQSNRDGDFEIFVMNANGTNQTNLTNNDIDDSGVTWSADGTQLAYGAEAAGGTDIWTMNADGSGHLGLISASDGQYSPDWVQATPRFEDVAFDDIFHGDIDWLAELGITKGCNPPANTLYCPDSSVTRGQMAAFMGRALGYTDDGGGNKFTDTVGSVFELDIDRLATEGVTKGCNPPTNDLFCPDAVVTRGQMAAFMHRALDGVLTPGPAVSFTDDDGLVFELDIEWLGATGITKGCNPPTNDLFCPSQAVTRGQMAAFLHRALG